MSNDFATLKSFFNSIEVSLSDVWLKSCLNWCKTEVLGPQYSLKDLQSKVYEQWLLLDLRDVDVPVLPPNLSSKKKFTLTGNFCLQMMQVMDISKPKLWQLQKIRNSNALTRGTQQDNEVVGTGKRVLQLTLTDGVQEIAAMEYRPVPCFSLNMSPGVKIRIMGPVVVRRGRLLLEPQNVKVLGGEVEELLVSNAAENVLARSLNLPENPNPGVIEEKALVVEKEDTNEGYVSNFKVKAPPPAAPTVDLTEEEELMMAHEIDLLMEAEADAAKVLKEEPPDIFEDPDFEDFEISHTKTSTQKPKAEVSLDDEDDDVFNNIDLDAHLDALKEKKPPAPSVITISKLLENVTNVSKGVFKIKAKFKGVEEKLIFTEGEYKLVIKIEDSSGVLVAKVHSDLVSSFAECTPIEMETLKSKLNEPAAREKILQALENVKNNLLKIDSILTIQIERDKTPVITKIL